MMTFYGVGSTAFVNSFTNSASLFYLFLVNQSIASCDRVTLLQAAASGLHRSVCRDPLRKN
jgi:hypothetical protein